MRVSVIPPKIVVHQTTVFEMTGEVLHEMAHISFGNNGSAVICHVHGCYVYFAQISFRDNACGILYLEQVCVLVNVWCFYILYLNALMTISAIGAADQWCILPVSTVSAGFTHIIVT